MCMYVYGMAFFIVEFFVFLFFVFTCVCMCVFSACVNFVIWLIPFYCIGMQLIPAEMYQDPGRMVRMLTVLYANHPVVFNNPDLLQVLNRMRAQEANRRNMHYQRRLQAITAIAPTNRL